MTVLCDGFRILFGNKFQVVGPATAKVDDRMCSDDVAGGQDGID